MSQSFAGQNLKYLRKLKGLTQEEFAQKLQIKRSLLGAYEEERAEPRVDVLEVVSDLFRVSLDDLLRRDLGESKGNYLSRRRQLKMAGENNLIHFVPMKAAAGYLAGYADDEFIDELNTFTLPMLGSGNFRAFSLIRSMQKIFLKSGKHRWLFQKLHNSSAGMLDSWPSW